MLFGVLNLSFWGDVLAALIMTQVSFIIGSIYLHRHQSHRALTLHPIISHLFRFWLWISTGIVTAQWVAVHRIHHVYTDVEGDPHSPVLFGVKKVLLEGAELYRKVARNPELVAKYSHGSPDDWIERNVYSRYGEKGVVIMLLLDLFLFGIPGITIWAIQIMCAPFWAAGFVNAMGHFFGYRHYDIPDASRNIFPVGVFFGGEELHHNHHAYPALAKLSHKWWEFDVGWMWISILCFFKLATVKKHHRHD